jgi:hypothetical protein
LKSLSFDEQTINESVLGLGVMLMFFFFGAMIILEINRMHFMKLGHVGYKMKSINEDDPNQVSASKGSERVLKGALEMSSEPISP